MQRPALALIFVAACSGASSPQVPAPTATKAKAPRANDLVKTSLVADASHVPAGGAVELGVRFVMQPGWHIYWVNPGESGLATEVEIAGPDGYEIGPARHPGPRSFPDETGVTYGYEGETVVFVTARAPREAAGTATFTAKASFLACREACLKGDATAELALPVGDGRPANESLLAPHAARLPGPPRADARTRWLDEEDARVLEIAVPGATEVELFPFSEQPTLVRSQDNAPGLARVRFQRADPSTPVVKGVLRVDRAYHSFERSWDP